MDNQYCRTHEYSLVRFNGREYTSRTCPWCEIESLQRDKADLIEVLEWYGDEGIYSPTYELDKEAVEECWICTPAEMVADSGKRARTILSRMK